MMVKLKDIGRSLQLPVSIFPLAALLNGLGYLIERMDWRVLNVAAVLLKSVGTMILNEMPLIFAVGIAYGLGKERNLCSQRTVLFSDGKRSFVVFLSALFFHCLRCPGQGGF